MPSDVKRVPGPDKKNLQVLIKGLDKAQGRVGWFESARYEDGTPIAGIAGVQEFGSISAGIPVRSFMRSTIMQKRREWSDKAMKGAKRVAEGKALALSVMDALASTAAGDIRAKIASIWAPELARRTVMARIRRLAAYQNLKTRSGKIRRMKRTMRKPPKSITKPLVDTGQMLDTLTYDVSRPR